MGAAFIGYRKIVFPVAKRCMPFYQLGFQSCLFEQLLIGYSSTIVDKIKSNEKYDRKSFIQFELRHMCAFILFLWI